VAPETRYARSGDYHIAYQVTGEGPLDLVYIPTWISQAEHYWEEPAVARYFGRLASFSRLIMFDRRGTGLSDPTEMPATLEAQMDDVVAVMDAVGSDRAAVYAQLEGGAMAALFAATHPERTHALVLYEAMARMSWAADYPWAPTRDERERWVAELDNWGDGSRILSLAPSSAGDRRLRAWFARLERLAASPGTAAKQMRMAGEVDVRAVLGAIRAPTLVLHRSGDRAIDVRHARWLAEHIPGARYLELPGAEALSFGADTDLLLDEIEQFLTGARSATESDRVLATVLFADVSNSTALAAELGDRRWRDLLETLHRESGREVERYRGQTIKTIGDGVLATFDGPARAIRCAAAIREAARSQLDLVVRAGLHTGEVEIIGSDVGGIGVHIAARVLACAAPGEILVSSTVKDLVVGSGIAFEDRGERELRGVPGSWRVWNVSTSDGTASRQPKGSPGSRD
jgi:class 3 adenylate cyclase